MSKTIETQQRETKHNQEVKKNKGIRKIHSDVHSEYFTKTTAFIQVEGTWKADYHIFE